MPTPAREPRNAFTDLIQRVNEVNAAAGAAVAGGSLPVRVGSGPSVETPAMRELSPEEVAERDNKLREIGILPPLDEDEAVTQVVAPSQVVGDIIGRAPTPRPQKRMAAPFLPNFKNVECFDFANNVIIIDGVSFPIPANDVGDMKGYAISIALDHVVRQLAEALVAFGLSPEAASLALGQFKESIVDGVSAQLPVRQHEHITLESESPRVPMPEMSERTPDATEAKPRGDSDSSTE